MEEKKRHLFRFVGYFFCLFVLGSTQQGLILSEFEWEVFPQGVLQ